MVSIDVLKMCLNRNNVTIAKKIDWLLEIIIRIRIINRNHDLNSNRNRNRIVIEMALKHFLH